MRVAHAGGAIHGSVYTNSIDALEYNKKYFNLFEIDFSWTSDGYLVCIHSWDDESVLSREEFEFHHKLNSDYISCDVEDLAQWLAVNKGYRIITDIKQDNVRGLKLIKNSVEHYNDAFIPQVYTFEQYHEAKAIGYRDIILTLYRSDYSLDQVYAFLKTEELYAVTMSLSKARREYVEIISHTGNKVYIHTVNDMEVYSNLREAGVFGIYTDSIKNLPFQHLLNYHFLDFLSRLTD